MAEIPYLKDGTKFSADSLNSRFDAAASTVNAVTADNLKRLALNPEQLPSIIGPVEGWIPLFTFTSENDEDIVSTPSVEGSDLTVGSFGVSFLDNPGYKITYSPALKWAPSTGGRTGSAEITAILVLGNVEVREFTEIDVQQTGDQGGFFDHLFSISLDEETWDAVVGIAVDTPDGAHVKLEHTERVVSPRVTMGTYAQWSADLQNMSPMRDIPGPNAQIGFKPHYKQFDYKTYQDVAIRTVITSDVLAAAHGASFDVAAIRFYFKSDMGRRYVIQRANLTAIPILAEVNT
mgnify:CR=1 FL=1